MSDDQERTDLLDVLARQRQLMRSTAAGLIDDQARTRSTVSALSVGGVVKHLTFVERRWCAFLRGGAQEMDAAPPGVTKDQQYALWSQQFTMTVDETLDQLLAGYDAAAAETDAQLRALADLDDATPLPTRPWFPPNTSWTARRVVLHLLSEIAQHSGHADIIRESIDGARATG